LALGDSGHFSNREMHPLAQRALREEVKGAALARGLRKIVDLFESFSPTASILGSLSLRALTDQSPADETVVTAAREQAKASASKVAIAAAVRAALYPTAASAIDPIVEFAAASSTTEGKVDLGKAQAVAQAIASLVAFYPLRRFSLAREVGTIGKARMEWRRAGTSPSATWQSRGR